MATFRFIKGKEPNPVIDNATKYELYEDLGGGISKKIDTQEFTINLNIPCAFYPDGEEARYADIAEFRKHTDKRPPLVKEGENGFVYYYRFEGTMDVNTGDRSFTNVKFKGVFYVDKYEETTFYCDDNGEVDDFGEGFGIYLSAGINGNTVTPEKIKVFSLPKGSPVNFVIFKTVRVFSSQYNVYRTTYIPLDVLEKNPLSFEVGPLEGEDFAGYALDTALVCFFDEKLNFLVGRDISYILDVFPDLRNEDNPTAPIYLSLNDLYSLSYPKKDEAKYVVFCSNITDTGKTAPECTVYNKTVCFPLFTHTRDEFGEGTEHTFYVKAIGDGLYYSDSEASYLEDKVNF